MEYVLFGFVLNYGNHSLVVPLIAIWILLATLLNARNGSVGPYLVTVPLDRRKCKVLGENGAIQRILRQKAAITLLHRSIVRLMSRTLNASVIVLRGP